MFRIFASVNAFVLMNLVLISLKPGEVNAQYSRLPILQGPYGKELIDCKASWNAISENARRVEDCMEKLIWAVGLRLKEPEGLPIIGIESLEPAVLPTVDLIDSPVLRGRMINVTAYHTSELLNPENFDISYDPATRIATADTGVKMLKVRGAYEASLNMGNLFGSSRSNNVGSSNNAFRGRRDSGPTQGSVTTGIGEATLYDARIRMKIHLRKRRSGGLVVSKVESDADFGEIDMQLWPSRENDPLANVMSSMLKSKDMVRTLAKEMAFPILNKEIAKRVGAVFYQGWDKMDQL